MVVSLNFSVQKVLVKDKYGVVGERDAGVNIQPVAGVVRQLRLCDLEGCPDPKRGVLPVVEPNCCV